jgi:hypothetical protein
MPDTSDWWRQSRTAIGRAFYSTSLGERMLIRRVSGRVAPGARHEAHVLVSQFLEDPTQLFSFEYDNSTSPPTFGDLFQVLMLARYLSLSGLIIEFVFVDSGNRRSDWMALSRSEQDRFLTEQVDLARELLPPTVAIRVDESRHVAADCATRSNSYKVLVHLLDQGRPIYPATPSLLHSLASSKQLPQPSGFLLDEDTEHLLVSPLPWVPGPYVAWHVRQGSWDPARDSTDAAMIRDFLELRQLFPSHSVMIFSTNNGINGALSALDHANLLGAMHDRGLAVTGQPVTGFSAAIPFILGADFYFQRRGGGIAMVPIFSHVPYLIISGDGNYYYGRKGSRLVPWANAQQRFIVAPYAVDSISIGSGLSRRYG